MTKYCGDPVNTSFSSATPEPGRPSGAAAGRWPVWARLPDVSAHLPSRSPRSNRPAATGPLDYRFDPPQPLGRQTTTAASSVAGNTADAVFGRPQPHLFQRSTQADYRSWAPRGGSRILPDSDPFAIPANSLQHTLAPVVRFLMLVALFTAAGTSILMIGRRNSPPAAEPPPPAAAATQQSLEAVANTPEQSVAVPTAAGPLGATKPQPSADAQAQQESAEMPSHSTDRTNDFPSPVPRDETDRPLPQAQTSEPPPAVARFTGEVLEFEPRQANHDDNQPSLH